MNSKFEHLVNEQYHTMMTKTVRSRYPKQIQFSEEFLEAISREYYTQILSEDAESPVKNRQQKFIKALSFIVNELAEKKDERINKYLLDEKSDGHIPDEELTDQLGKEEKDVLHQNQCKCTHAAEGCNCDGCPDCKANNMKCEHACQGCSCDGCADCKSNQS